MRKAPAHLFRVSKVEGSVRGHKYDSVTQFFDPRCHEIARYYYWQGQCNYLISWGFEPESLGEFRQRKARKAKKPFFSLSLGWYGYV